MVDDPSLMTRPESPRPPGVRPPGLRPLVSVVITSHDGLGLLLPCLESLGEMNYSRAEIVLVDNASVDGTAGRVAADFPEVRLVGLDANMGFAGGNNAGIAQAVGNYIFLLNNDTTIAVDAVDRLVEFMELHPRAGLVGPLTVRHDDPATVDNVGLALYPDGTVRGAGRGEPAGRYVEPFEVFCPSGCACFCRREVLEEVGLLDEDFHLMLEDADLGWRVRLAGWECYCVPSAVVRHKGSSTIGLYSARKAYYVERNRIWLAVKYFPPKILWRSPFYSMARYGYQAFAIFRGEGASAGSCKAHGPWLLLWTLVRAYSAAALGTSLMWKRRRRIAAGRRVDDSEVLEWFDRYGLSARTLALTD